MNQTRPADSGYAATPQLTKRGIGERTRVTLDGAPPDWQFAEQSSASVFFVNEDADIVIAFVRSTANLECRIHDLAQRVFPAAVLWVAWPRRAAGHASDITETGIREICLPLGLVDVKVAAIDVDWSGLKLVWRKALRQGKNPLAIEATE